MSAASGPARRHRPLRPARVLLLVTGAALLVVLLVGFAGALIIQRTAEQEAVNDAAHTTDVLVNGLVQPEVTNGLADGDPAAVTTIDRLIHERVLGPALLRVKVWDIDGRIVYSDEPRLQGQAFPLGGKEQEVLTTSPTTRADVTDLREPENSFERGQGKLLEVYRPVWTPDGRPLLFETYAPFRLVVERSGRLWGGFAGITLSSVLLLVVLLARCWSGSCAGCGTPSRLGRLCCSGRSRPPRREAGGMIEISSNLGSPTTGEPVSPTDDLRPTAARSCARRSSAFAETGGYRLYLRQEGAGIGLCAKLDAYALQDAGLDTYAANVALGRGEDERDHATAAEMLSALGVEQIDLLSNNPDKAAQLRGLGLDVHRQIPTGIHLSDASARYLRAKVDHTAHQLALPPTA